MKRTLCILLSLMLAVTGFAGLCVPAAAAETGKAVNLVTNGAADYITGAQASSVWFGNYKQSSDGAGSYNVDPVKWRVLSNADGKLFLLADQNLDVVRYNETYAPVTWETCTLRAWLNGYDGHPYDDAFITSAFTGKELSAVADSSEYGTSGGNDTTDKVFLLSIADAMNTNYGFPNNNGIINPVINETVVRESTNTAYVAAGGHSGSDKMSGIGKTDFWWLRSPGLASGNAAFVTHLGIIAENGDYVDSLTKAVRPALNVDLNSVLFTSAAEGGKAGDGLTASENYTGTEWKMTLLDDSRSGFSASCIRNQDGVYTIAYSGAQTGENEKISAVIVDADGVVTYYGVLCDAEAGDNNTVTVDVSGKMNKGDKLYVFNEQYNGDKKTDYASALHDVTGIGSQRSLIVDRTFLKEGVNTANAKTIWYGGSPWRVIGYDGQGGASTADTMTLFSAGSMGTTMFDQDGNTKKQYSGSDLQKQTNQIFNNAFSGPEQLAVKDTTLGSGTYDGANTDGVEGSSVGYARLWPLSTREANAVNADLRKDSGDWWLRSPGDGSNNVGFVTKQGNVDHSGRSFRSELGVRPAFYVDLDRVIFASAAVGGKQGDGALTPIDGYHGSEWKLTVWEGNHRWFSVTETEASGIAGGTFTLHYQYAETGENEYISAIVTDADGNALYYGRIAQATTEDGTVDITIPVELPGGSYTLKLFNEHYNGDKKTDFSSPLIDVALTVYGGNSKALQMTESGTAENILGTQQSNIWFGSYQQSSDGNGGYNVDPIKWRVLQNDSGKLLLLSDRSLDAKMYYPQPLNVTWAESTIRSWLNGYDGTANMAGEDHSGDSFKGSAFTETEFAAVAETDVVTENSPEYGTPGGRDTKDKVFLLSLAEAINTVYGFTNSYEPTDTRVSLNTDYAKECSTDYYGNSYSVGRWWLRSPGRDGFDAVYIENDGSVYEYGLRVFHHDPCVVRPALNVNLNKVIFTSAAEGGKQGDGLTTVPYYDGADWKLTVLDAERSGFTASGDSRTGDVWTVNYSGAKTGNNEYISAVIVDGDGAVTYYGRLCKAASGDNNTITVDVSGKMNEGDKLYVFNEQYNGDKKTDYASNLIEIGAPSETPAGGTIRFGSYPQSRVRDSATLRALNAAVPDDESWTSYGYYSGTDDELDGQMSAKDYMQYCDVTVNGMKYRGVRFSQYRPFSTGCTSSADNSLQDENGYTTDTIYWFHWDPLQWRVLDPDAGLLLCESAIDAQPYQNLLWRNGNKYYQGLNSTVYANDYATSSVREWLNNDFLNAAFTSEQESMIAETTLDNRANGTKHPIYDSAETTDKIFLLSSREAASAAYGFNAVPDADDDARMTIGTDYALCQGVEVDENHVHWLLRSAGYIGDTVCAADQYGGVGDFYGTAQTGLGIRPAITVDLEDFVSSYKTGDIVEYGSYPQAKVTDDATIDALNAAAPDSGSWTSYGYYSGEGETADGQMTAKDYMRYCDVTVDGQKYRGVTFSSYRPNNTGYKSAERVSAQHDNGFRTGVTYWFRYEPLQWRVLDPATGIVLCETLIDSQAYNNYALFAESDGNKSYWGDADKTHYANNYAEGSLRQWLNDDFLGTAFTAEQEKRIAPSTLDNSACRTDYSDYDSVPTTDKVFLLSWNDVLTPAYGFSAEDWADDPVRQTTSTDYAKCQGVAVSSRNGCSSWYLRSAGEYSGCVCAVNYDGWINTRVNAYVTTTGIRPAITLDLYLLNAPAHVHAYGEPVWDWANDYSSATAKFTCSGCGDEQTVTDNYIAETVVSTANCTHGLIKKYTASVTLDGTEYTDTTDEVTVPGTTTFHILSDWTEPVPATCGNAGSVGYYTCKTCGAHIGGIDTGFKTLSDDEIVIPATGNHTWEWITDTDPTCGADGVKHEECAVCHAVQSENTTIPATGNHTWEWITDTEPTCGADGVKHEECNVCHATQSENTPIPATGNHTWEWITDTEPTCGADGVKHEECSVCHAVQSENTPIPATGNHDWKNEWSKDGVNHWHDCTRCDEKNDEAAHTYGDVSYTWEQTRGAWKATAKRACTVCEWEETETVNATGSETKPATCTVNGETTYTAQFENAAFETQQKTVADIAALDHDWKTAWSKDGVNHWHDCTRCDEKNDEAAHTYGEVTYTWEQTRGAWKATAKRACTVCGWEESETVNAAGAQSKAPTCTVNGETTYTATFDNPAFTTQTKTVDDIAALDHAYDAVVTEPTCTEDGYTTHTCSRCGDSYTDSETDALGHVWGDWEIVRTATPNEKGEKKRVCTRCGEVETAEIDELILTSSVDGQTGSSLVVTVPYAKRGAIATTLTAEEPVTYTSSNPKLLTVDENGNVQFVRLCIFCKSATITTVSADGSKVATCKVNIEIKWWQYIIWFFLGSLWF